MFIKSFQDQFFQDFFFNPDQKSRKAEICHIRFFIYQNPCLGMAKSLSWAVTKYCVEVGWAVTKYQVGSRCGVVS